jgi:periplasmic protein TonB
VFAPSKNLVRPRHGIARPQSIVRSWPFTVSFGLHLGLVVTGTILGARAVHSPRAAVRYSVLQPDASQTPLTPPVPPALPPVEVFPVQQETLDEMPELPVLPMVAEPAPLPVPEDVPEPMRAQLADCAMTRIRRHEQVPPPAPSETQRQTQDEAPSPVTAAELTAAAPSPDLGNCPAPQYPPSARRHHIQGTVIVSFEVAEDGQVLSCAIFTSSGYAMLDDAALEVARTWRFTGGAGRVNVPFSFVLHARGS